jgi:hypothetical protein
MISEIEIDRENLYKLYMVEVNRISNDLDWKSNFGPFEIVNMISTILENNPQLIKKS